MAQLGYLHLQLDIHPHQALRLLLIAPLIPLVVELRDVVHCFCLFPHFFVKGEGHVFLLLNVGEDLLVHLLVLLNLLLQALFRLLQPGDRLLGVLLLGLYSAGQGVYVLGQ